MAYGQSVARPRSDHAGSRHALTRRGALMRTLAETARDDISLIVLEAPAGYGKTTVLRQWAAEDPRDFAWVRLREAGTDLDGLLTSIGLALQRIMQRDGDAASAPGRTYILVLDGLEGRSRSAGAAIRALATKLPPQCQLVITSRDRLGLDLSALPGGRRCLFLAPNQFTFTADETRDALARAGLDGPEDTVRQLMQRTEGWPAGVGLAALSLRDQPDVAAAAARFDGDDVRVVAYFRNEVLDRQPPEIRRFLLHTAVLDEMSGRVCDAVLATTGSAAQLDAIQGRGLFIRSSTTGRGWYRYHPLFAGMLRSELRHRHPDEEPALRRRAARWFAQHGQPERAIEHAIAAGDLQTAAPLVIENAQALMDSGQFETARAWIEALGDEAPTHYPPVGVAAAWVWAMAGDGPRALRSVLAAERGAFEGVSPDGSSSVASGAAMIRAAMAPLGVERMLLDAERAFELEPPGRRGHPVAAMLLGNARLMNGDTDGAVGAFERSIRLSRESQPATAQFGLAQLALIAAQRNDWAVAGECAAESVALMHAGRRNDHLPSVITYAASAQVAARQEHRQDALHDVGEAVRLYTEQSPAGFSWFASQVAIAVGSILLDLGDVPGALSMAAAAQRHILRLLTEGVLSDQLRILEERLATAGQPHAAPAAGALSGAELRVLEMLPSHLALGEIGDHLHLSRNTVKTHVAAIHRKLGCSARTEAVRRARELGLLQS
jgi:LuxR family maltose regulon positive regulatory protein